MQFLENFFMNISPWQATCRHLQRVHVTILWPAAWVKRSLLLNAFTHNSDLVTFSSSVLTNVCLQIGQKISPLPKRVAVHLLNPLLTVTGLSERFGSYASNIVCEVYIEDTCKLFGYCWLFVGENCKYYGRLHCPVVSISDELRDFFILHSGCVSGPDYISGVMDWILYWTVPDTVAVVCVSHDCFTDLD